MRCLFTAVETPIRIFTEMISRRDKLLTQPWEQIKFNKHKNKIATATAVIDFGPPASRNHVRLKLKKCQKEAERCEKIAQDNVRLLQRLGAIMKVNRLDNYWSEAPPSFLNRETLFKPKSKNFHVTKIDVQETKDVSPVRRPRTCPHVTHCKACSITQSAHNQVQEERVPWAKPGRNPSAKVVEPVKKCRQCAFYMHN